jgi:hypothetical protein
LLLGWGRSAVKLGGRWRSRNPLRFFVISEVISLVVLVLGAGILGAATPASGPAHQPGGAIGGSLFGVGLALMVIFLVLGAIDLARYLRGLRGQGRGASSRPDAPTAERPKARPRRSAGSTANGWQDERVQLPKDRRVSILIRGLRGQGRGASSRPDAPTAERPKARPRRSAGSTANGWQDEPVQLPKDRRVSILILGYPGSGKTIMLASLYRHFALGGPAGIRFATDDASNTDLLRLADTIRDAPSFPVGTRPGETKTWTFSVRVESGVQDAGAFTLEYLDYAGGYLRQLAGSGGDPPDQQFVQTLAAADVLIGVLDGDLLRQLMSGVYDPAIVVPIERLLNVLIRASQRNIHLIVTKWDMMRGPGGSYYTVPDVITTLERVSDDFRRFRQHPRLASMRIIPVAALGLNGFVRFAELGGSGMVKVPGVPWEPWNVEIPFFCAVPDILQNDVPKMDGRADGSLSRITIAALSLLNVMTTGVTAAMSFGLVNLTFQPSQFIDRLQAYLGAHHERGQVPQNLGEREAVGYVVNECYAAVKEFEQRMPGTRIGGPGG